MSSGLTVTNNTSLDRFELHIDGNLAGTTEYQDTAGERAFVHTEIYPRYEGQGYGRKLVKAALDTTRDEGYGILPLCPMVHHFVESRPEYLALVPHWARERFGLPR
ncbi:GNAT family N-acetyltransferase [Nocardia transvalensis]|uniref:GNAT family N-acetyltransferase n=1 Tax=Nocardia transvalensis TaxID=37333 RepID=UPI002B4B6B6A|nr:GNAT family N-acetyltransferase [Nocardia transvalensis]